MPIKNGTIIKLGDILTTTELKFVDNTTKKTLKWFTNACLEAEVNLDDSAEIVAFCRYLIVSLAKTERLLEHIHKKDMSLLAVNEQLLGKE